MRALTASVLAASILLFPAGASAVKEKTLVYDYEGNVAYTRRGKTQVVTLDMPVRAGDVFTTDAESKIDFTFHSMAGFRMMSNGRCTIVKVADSDMRVKLEQGDMLVKMNPPSGYTTSFEVETAGAKVSTKQRSQFLCLTREEAGKGVVSTVGPRQGVITVFVKIKASALNLTDNQILDVPSQGNSIPSIRSPEENEAYLMRQSNGIQIGEV